MACTCKKQLLASYNNSQCSNISLSGQWRIKLRVYLVVCTHHPKGEMLTLIDIKCAADGRILPLSILPFSALLKASSFPSSLPLTTPELLAAHRRPIHYISSIITPINCTMKFLLASLPILAYAISSVSAHGYVNNVNIGGTDFSGSAPASGSTDGVVRVISTTSPVKGADNPSLNCGQDATAVSDIAKGSPGDVMAFSWNSGGGNVSFYNLLSLDTSLMACSGRTTLAPSSHTWQSAPMATALHSTRLPRNGSRLMSRVSTLPPMHGFNRPS